MHEHSGEQKEQDGDPHAHYLEANQHRRQHYVPDEHSDFATSVKLSHHLQFADQNISITANAKNVTGSVSNGIVEIEVVVPAGAWPIKQPSLVQNLGVRQ